VRSRYSPRSARIQWIAPSSSSFLAAAWRPAHTFVRIINAEAYELVAAGMDVL
jgi:hypothetical protein